MQRFYLISIAFLPFIFDVFYTVQIYISSFNWRRDFQFALSLKRITLSDVFNGHLWNNVIAQLNTVHFPFQFYPKFFNYRLFYLVSIYFNPIYTGTRG
jgi:hypothetical protein